MQMLVVETGGRPAIVGGDVAVWFGEFDEPPAEGRQRVLTLNPELVWLTHERDHGDPAPSEATHRRVAGSHGRTSSRNGGVMNTGANRPVGKPPEA